MPQSKEAANVPISDLPVLRRTLRPRNDSVLNWMPKMLATGSPMARYSIERIAMLLGKRKIEIQVPKA